MNHWNHWNPFQADSNEVLKGINGSNSVTKSENLDEKGSFSKSWDHA